MTAAIDLPPGLSLHSHNYSRTPTIYYFVSISGYYVTSRNNPTARAHTHTHVPLILDPCQDKFGLEIQILVRNNHEKQIAAVRKDWLCVKGIARSLQC